VETGRELEDYRPTKFQSKHRQPGVIRLRPAQEVHIVETRKSRVLRIALFGSVILALALTPVAFAGGGGGGGKKGGGGGGTTTGGGTLALVMVTDKNGNGAPDWGDTVTWRVTSSSVEPHVDLTCSRGGTVIYSATTGFYASYPWPWTQQMTLTSTLWSSGSASCVGKLYYFSGSGSVTQASVSFTAGA